MDDKQPKRPEKGTARAAGTLKNALRFLWGAITRNIGIKLLSLIIAILLWSNVVSNNTNITRMKTLNGLTGSVTGQVAMNTNYRLALLEDPTDRLTDISVVVEVPKARYGAVSAENVQVTLDLSGVRSAGVQEIPLRAVTAYGRVVQVLPQSLPLTVEVMDSRIVPVRIDRVGEQEGWWYNVTSTNPSPLTIRGAASVVQRLAMAVVAVDVSAAEDAFEQAEPYTLYDSQGQEIAAGMLERPASVSVAMEVYPKRVIPFPSMQEMIVGTPAEGYVVESVTVSPQVSVAAEQEILDSIDTLSIEPVNVEGLATTTKVARQVNALSSFRYLSSDEVYVTVVIREETVVDTVEAQVEVRNVGEGLRAVTVPETVTVQVTGPRSSVERLKAEGMTAGIDASGLPAGNTLQTPELPDLSDANPELQLEAQEVELRLEEVRVEEES